MHEYISSLCNDSNLNQETWDGAKARWEQLDGSWPMARGSGKQKSYVHANPTHLFAGLLNCKCCGEELRMKKAQFEKIQMELQNLLNFIKAGNFSKVVSDAIVDAENRSGKLKSEMDGLEYQKKNSFKAPPKEWIAHRLENFHETLEKNTKESALALKELLGAVEMEPVGGECVVENGNLVQAKPYYVAHSNIRTFVLLEENKGSNWLHCRKR